VHNSDHPFAPLDCVEEPGVSIGDFLRLVCEGLDAWELGIAFVLVDRLTKLCSVPVSPISAHRLILTAIIISVKVRRECTVMEHFSETTGLDTIDLCRMEAAFLSILAFDVHVRLEEIESMETTLRNTNATDHGGLGFVPLVPITSPRASKCGWSRWPRFSLKSLTPPSTPRCCEHLQTKLSHNNSNNSSSSSNRSSRFARFRASLGFSMKSPMVNESCIPLNHDPIE